MFEGRMTGKAETERRGRQLAATARTADEEAIGKDEMDDRAVPKQELGK